MKANLLLCVLILGIAPAYSQNKVPSLSVTFDGHFGCNYLAPTPAVFSVEDGAYFMGRTSCDIYGAAAYSPTGFGFINSNGCCQTAVSSRSVLDTYSNTYCLVRPNTSQCDPWTGAILPLSTSGTWVVGGNNFIYHGGAFFDPTQGAQTNWISVITNPRGDAFVLGYAAAGFPTKNAFQPTGSGLLLAEFSGANNSLVYATYLSSLGLDTVVGIARDNGGNVYLSGGGLGGPVLAKLSPSLPQRIVYRKSVPYGGGPIAVDAYSQVYMEAGGVGVPMVNAPQPISAGPNDESIVVFSPKADRIVYSSYMGGYPLTPVGISLVASYPNGYDALLGGLEYDNNWNKNRDPSCTGEINPDCTPWSYTATFGPLLRSSIPATLNFHLRKVGTTTVLKLPLKSTGSAPIAIAGITSSGSSAFTLKNTCAGILKPDATCMIALAFTPTSTGTQAGFLVVSSDSLDSPQTVKLNGTGR